MGAKRSGRIYCFPRPNGLLNLRRGARLLQLSTILPMTRYISLMRFTDQGAKKMKDSPGRAKAFRALAKKAGVKVEAQFWTTGTYDAVLILNGKEKNVLRCLSELAAAGNVRSESLRAFDEGEFSGIVG